MSFANPTPLRLDARGTLHGWSATVAGRVVLGVELNGERCYWQEFNLVDAAGNAGTLVYEEGDDGPEWKLFQQITPPQPLTVSEAETKRVGDRVSFGRDAIPITLVDRSRVYHIEGAAPEGVEVGDLADFFNADAGDHMIVASWTGNEIEFFEGRDVPAATVAGAFGFPPPEEVSPSSFRASDSASTGHRRNSWVALGGMAVVAILAAYSCSGRKRAAPAAANPFQRVQAAPTLRLAHGASGTLGQRAYTVGAQSLLEIGRVNGRFERREYQLTTDRPESALLVNGLTGGSKQWHLLQPATPPRSFTAFAAAALRKGQQVNLGGDTATVTELFFSETRSTQGNPPAGWAPPGRHYGFVATSPGGWWLVRWSERELSLYRGAPVDEKIVFAALGPGPEKAR